MLRIEFAITLRCNTDCPSCSRHSYLHPFCSEESDVTMEQLNRFVDEVKGHNRVDYIWITGGEPTVHPRFNEIVSKLKTELLAAGHLNRLIVVSNGIIPIDKSLGVDSLVLRPKDKLDVFRCQYVAPYDTGQEVRICPVPIDDGAGFSAYGWYPCGGGSAICMLFDLAKYHRDTIPNTIEDFGPLDDLCRLCQVSAKRWMFVKDFGVLRSRSFREAFSRFDASKLRRY